MKRSVTILIVLTMVLMLFPTTIWAGATEVTVSDAEELKSAFANWENDETTKNVELLADIEIGFSEVTTSITLEKVNTALRLGGTKTITLDLNGHKLYGKYTGSEKVCMILVEDGTLNIESSEPGGEITIETENPASVSSVIKAMGGLTGVGTSNSVINILSGSFVNKGVSIDACVIDMTTRINEGVLLSIEDGVFINSSQTATIKINTALYNPAVAKVLIENGIFINYGAGKCVEIYEKPTEGNVSDIITIESGRFTDIPESDYLAVVNTVQRGSTAEISLGLDSGYYMIIPTEIELGDVMFDQGHNMITKDFSVGIRNFVAGEDDKIVVSIASDNKLRNGSGVIEYELYKGTGGGAETYDDANAEFASFSITDTSDKNGEVRVDIANLSGLPAGNYTGQLIFFFGFEK